MSANVPLLVSTSGPLRGPRVPLTRKYTTIVATGVEVGDVVLVNGLGQENFFILEITSSGEYTLPDISSAKYLQAVRVGSESKDLSIYLQGT